MGVVSMLSREYIGVRVAMMAILVGLFVSSPVKAATDLSKEVEQAVLDYFIPSGRKVESLRFESTSRLSDNEYLVELEVIAQQAFGVEYIPYHCGVFMEKKLKSLSVYWKVSFITCEPSVTSRPSFGS